MKIFAYCGLLLLLFATCSVAAKAPYSYLRAGDEIVCVGDSVTAQGLYEKFLQQALDTQYPGAGIRVVNKGVNGLKAGAGENLLNSAIKEGKPTIAFVMFGVNDTQGKAIDDESKIKTFLTGTNRTVELARKNKIDVILLRETHSGHGFIPGIWETGVNDTLLKIFAAEKRFAAENTVPFIDVGSAYGRALAAAWSKDHRYEFSPDAIHPTASGHAAVAAELMRALGVGLPLAPAGERGPLHLADEPTVTLQTLDGTAVPDLNGKATVSVRVSVQNLLPDAVSGDLSLQLGNITQAMPLRLEAQGNAIATFVLPLSQMTERWEILPLYVTFKTANSFDAASTLFWQSTILPAMQQPYLAAKDAFFSVSTGADCPVKNLQVSRQQHMVAVKFNWDDANPVAAQPGNKDRYGVELTTLLNLNESTVQICDAVECLFDTRPPLSIGRYTSNTEANPEGIIRVGIFTVEENGRRVPKFESIPTLPDGAVTLIPADRNAYELRITLPDNPSIGFSMRVTDTKEYKRYAGTLYRLTGTAIPTIALDPMSFIQLGTTRTRKIYRIGY